MSEFPNRVARYVNARGSRYAQRRGDERSQLDRLEIPLEAPQLGGITRIYCQELVSISGRQPAKAV